MYFTIIREYAPLKLSTVIRQACSLNEMAVIAREELETAYTEANYWITICDDGTAIVSSEGYPTINIAAHE